MADEKQKPITREDVLKAIEENGGKAKGLDLSGKHFEEGIDLHGLDLQEITLDGAVFPQKFEFGDPDNPKLVTKSTGANLQEVDFSFASLNYTYLGEARLQKAKFYYSKMQKAYLVEANLEEANLSFAELHGTHFERVNFYRVDLHGAEFNNDTNFDLVHWADYILGEEKNGLFIWAEDTYRRLKQWYTNAGFYDIAGEFFFREMTSQRKRIEWWPQPQHRLWSAIHSFVSGYGERPLRVFRWGALVLFGSALLYFFLQGVAPHTLTAQGFLNSLYYSAVSFTALGYGPWFDDISVHSWVQGAGATEAFIGVFTIALFLVTFTRKMRR